jgi:hypothetical protein
MAKNFPYFKFVATEWLTGDIVYEDFHIQGLFINICALYWQRDGKLSLEDINKRYKTEIIGNLIDRFFTVNDGFISIKFLDEQLIDAGHISKVNSENGKKGAMAKRNKANAKRTLSDTQANLSKEEEKKNKNKNKNNNKSKEEKEIKVEDIILYFTENGYSDIAAKKFYNYYSVSNWKDGKGNEVKNWKQKAQAVWFKDENKIPSSEPKFVM